MSARNHRKRRSAKAMANGYQRIRQDHASELAEDYVELIDDLIRETGEARAVDLASRLGVTHVTVTKAIGRLKDDDLVRSEPYRAIFLTDKGKRLASQVRRRHEVVVQFLLKHGVSPDVAEADAEGIEHHVSRETLEAMRKFVGA